MKQLTANQIQIIQKQGVLIKNSDYNISEKKKIWNWITSLDKGVKERAQFIIHQEWINKSY